MKTEKITLKNETGLHARPATILVNQASKFSSNINLRGVWQKPNTFPLG